MIEPRDRFPRLITQACEGAVSDDRLERSGPCCGENRGGPAQGKTVYPYASWVDFIPRPEKIKCGNDVFLLMITERRSPAAAFPVGPEIEQENKMTPTGKRCRKFGEIGPISADTMADDDRR